MSILVKNARYVITVDSKRRIFREGAVAIDDGLVVAVGKSEEVCAKFPTAEHVIDASNCIVTPGLIDCHLHTALQLARGVADNVFLPTWIHERIYPFEAELKPHETYISSLTSLVEAVKTGTTFFADPGTHNMDSVVEAVQRVGIRAVLARSLIDISTAGRPVPDAMRESTADAIRSGEEFVRKYNGCLDGRVKAWFSLRTERATSNELAAGVKQKADQYRTGIISHVSNAQDSVNRHKEIFKMTPLERYHKVGILGPNLVIYHCNWLTDYEIELVKRYGVKVISSPSSAFAAASGTLVGGKFEELLRAGVTVALGADNAAASNYLDMVRVANAMTAHRDRALDATIFSPEELLEMLTINGARALLSDGEVGSIQEGMKADLVVFDAKKPGWIPLLNPISNLIHSASGESTRDVIVDGKIVMEGGVVQDIDEEELRLEAEKVAEDVGERAGVKRHANPRWPLT